MTGGAIVVVAEALQAKRSQDNECDEKTGRQARFIFALFARYMNEVDLPYIRVAPNAFCRIKNLQSVRNLALHPEVIRLGFLDYFDAIKALGYQRLFPDLYSPSTRSPLGDRLYKELLHSLRAVGFTPHQIRHFFGDELKQNDVVKEFRADFLGHGGESETTERYCNPINIQKQMEHLLKLPVVPGHLQPRSIQLLPWVTAKEVAPWSRAAKVTKDGRGSVGVQDA